MLGFHNWLLCILFMLRWMQAFASFLLLARCARAKSRCTKWATKPHFFFVQLLRRDKEKQYFLEFKPWFHNELALVHSGQGSRGITYSSHSCCSRIAQGQNLADWMSNEQTALFLCPVTQLGSCPCSMLDKDKQRFVVTFSISCSDFTTESKLHSVEGGLVLRSFQMHSARRTPSSTRWMKKSRCLFVQLLCSHWSHKRTKRKALTMPSWPVLLYFYSRE